MQKLILTLFFLATTFTLVAQDSELTLERIFSSNEFQSERSKSLRWFNGGNDFTTLEMSAKTDGGFDIVKTNTRNGTQEVLIPAEWLIPEGSKNPLRIADYEWSEDKRKVLIFTNTARVWRYHTKGDYWVLNLNTKKLKKVGGVDARPSTLMFAKFSPDGNKVAYVREHNIYVESLADDKITALTTDGTDKIINGTFDWVYEEEFSCRDGFRWSPDGTKIAYWRLDASTIKNFLMINNTDSLYSFTIPVQYPKAGEKPSEAKVGVVNVNGGKTTWMQLPGDAANQYIPRMIWKPNSEALLVQHINREQNHNKVTLCDVNTGAVKVVYEDKETAWLDAVDDFQYLKDGNSFTWVSQKSGWKAAYKITNGKEIQLTSSDYDMINIVLIDEKYNWLYFMASPNKATQKYLYRTKMNGKGKAERLTPKNQPGTHSYDISPNGKFAKHNYSTAEMPPITELISLPNHEVLKTLVSNSELKQKVSALDRNPMEFFKVSVNDGTSLDAYMIKPTDFDASEKYPVLFYVYGEPWNQTVKDAWGGSNYLWHLYLAQQGYIVMSIDNRGTPAPKGREWRKSVYGQIGVLSSKDQAEATQKIVETYPFVDEDRIGIWGWSGGGSMTLNMMFRYPEIYKTGISVAPVPDQRLYDNIYQERYSGVPQLMPESYQKGSPINYAKNLEGNLLVLHGTGDDNVHYQGTEMLINELIKHNKIFSMMSYPNRSHGIHEGENTSRHLREILTNYLITNLPAGAK
ncbi:S9 family peptidase [Aureibaculum sp. 2210JD6-5]|uniref:S9 family peptidase n=1 Tax=Aureibaculum sp. 2210JD6-5 TaxID=3103957 RepID=UPI002AADFCE1|nr:S9 family peptidase [Aureibaculum sp. 2210JD6-5]MDY7395854.1 S9 family peptidase [Aureibaculum sp. 2210JD6-5]